MFVTSRICVIQDQKREQKEKKREQKIVHYFLLIDF
jgi:hypothetical protein